eukprot:CAMPEP_0119406912 /NCGR_PEP_ID=MMETSP1335-20130426/1051_1 /TAXON_ID=259385 /ORGANISM="Chrysoculter rhomboideus, Strain RCC1486" /LENGTH=74 /DNA_ID=CAMNT_0007431005 /DNA_START=102 /DNA_END=326 /DNA_ORIENTATION=+
MCMRTSCSTCGRPTWAGCGGHKESALRGVPEADRCPGWRTGRCAAKVERAYVPPEDKPTSHRPMGDNSARTGRF